MTRHCIMPAGRKPDSARNRMGGVDARHPLGHATGTRRWGFKGEQMIVGGWSLAELTQIAADLGTLER